VYLLIAEALLAERADADDIAAELADHLARAGEAARAVPFAITAARQAAAARANDEAVQRFEQVLSLMARTDERRLELLLEAAASTLDPLDRRAALAFADEALSLARARNDPVAEVRALWTHERDLWHASKTAEQIELVTRMLGLVEGRDDAQEAMVLRLLSRLLVLSDRLEEAEPLLRRGIAVAERAGHDVALSGLYGTRALMSEVATPAWRAAVDASVRHARISGDADALGNILTNSGYMQVWGGALGAARAALDEATAVYGRIRPTDRYAPAGLSWVLSLTGDYDRARAIAEPIATAPDAPPRIVALTALAEVGLRTGSPDTGDVVQRLLDDAAANGTAQRLVPALAAAARLAVAEGSIPDATTMFEQALETTTNHKDKGSHWMFSPDHAAALAAEREISRLANWVGRIRQLTAADGNAHNQAALLLCEGHLAVACDDAAKAREVFRDAADDYAAMPCPARVGEAYLGLADAEWAAGDVDASRAAARRAREIAAGIGADTLVSHADDAVRRASAAPVLATVLFTDLVGSTERAVAVGDAAWRATLERHHAIVRRELSRHSGREIDTAGDGFLASFDTPAQAIRCACAIRATLEQVGLTVRAGIHTGECQVSDGKLAGLAVHIAARVSASAAPSEVLVSSTVRDLVAGSGIEFDDRGVHTLKGVPGDWRLYGVPRVRATAS
jgi:class 3 adenylate cyclase